MGLKTIHEHHLSKSALFLSHRYSRIHAARQNLPQYQEESEVEGEEDGLDVFKHIFPEVNRSYY